MARRDRDSNVNEFKRISIEFMWHARSGSFDVPVKRHQCFAVWGTPYGNGATFFRETFFNLEWHGIGRHVIQAKNCDVMIHAGFPHLGANVAARRRSDCDTSNLSGAPRPIRNQGLFDDVSVGDADDAGTDAHSRTHLTRMATSEI